VQLFHSLPLLQGLPLPDSVPNYLTSDANGNVGAVFTGKIEAFGVTLPAQEWVGGIVPPDLGDPPNVEWVRSSDGGLVANIYGERGVNGLEIDRRWHAKVPHDDLSGLSEMTLHNDTHPSASNPTNVKGLKVSVNDSAGAFQKTLMVAAREKMGPDMASDFVQLSRTTGVTHSRTWKLYGPLQATFVALGVQATTFVDVAVGGGWNFATATFSVPLGFVNGTDQISCGYGFPGGNVVRIFFRNVSNVGSAINTWFGWLMSIDA